jgi:hypothetical protein
MVAPQVIANRETGVTLHVPSFSGPTLQTARFGRIFRAVWRKGYGAARPALPGALRQISHFVVWGEPSPASFILKSGADQLSH